MGKDQTGGIKRAQRVGPLGLSGLEGKGGETLGVTPCSDPDSWEAGGAIRRNQVARIGAGLGAGWRRAQASLSRMKKRERGHLSSTQKGLA